MSIKPKGKKRRKEKENKLDPKDHSIIKELKRDSQRPIRKLARILKMRPTTLYKRKKRLEKSGIIKAYRAMVDHEKLGQRLTVLIHVVIASPARGRLEKIVSKLRKSANVDDVYMVSGRYDIIVKARFRDTEELGKFIFHERDGLRALHGIERTESMIVVQTSKEYGLAVSAKRQKILV